jgi:hypothetical protein
MRSNNFVAGGHESIVALRGCFDAAAQGRIDETLLQILCLFPASTLICPGVSLNVGFLDIHGEEFWEVWSPARLELPHVP